MAASRGLLTIRLRLALIILVAALPATGLFIQESLTAYRQAHHDAAQDLLEQARVAAHNERHIVQGVHDLLTAISENPFIQRRDMLSCNEYFDQLNRHYMHFRGFAIVDVQGSIICAGNRDAVGLNVADRSYFMQVLRDKKFISAGYLVNRVSGAEGVAFIMPIFNDGPPGGSLIGAVGTTLRLEAFSGVARDLGTPAGAMVSIVDQNGVVLVTEPGRQQEVGKPIASDTLRAGLFSAVPHVLEETGSDGVTRLFAVAPAMFEGRAIFHAIIGLDKASLAAPALRSLQLNLLALLSAVLLSLLGTWIVSKHLLLRPVRKLTDAAQQVAAGNLHARSGLDYRSGELGELARRFDAMTVALAQRDRKMRASSQYIEYLAHHEETTRLPNRRYLNLRLAKNLEEARKSGHMIAVLFIDLDRFRVINDSLGHAAGDLLLGEVAQRLKAGLAPGDMLAHLGSDEFVCVLNSLGDPAQAQAHAAAARIRERLALAYEVADQRVTLGSSIGICLCPLNCPDAPTAIKYAEMAMRSAKESGSGIQFFAYEVNGAAVSRLAMENELRTALQRGEFRLHFQPQVELAGNRVVAAETLLRWQHPEKGLLSPSNFIALAEESRLILEIGAWTLDNACAQCRSWLDAGVPAVQISVNVSAHQFRQPGFADRVAQALARNRLPAGMLELEVTESILLNDVDLTLHALRKMGVGLAIDDFGTGYSSLSYLKDLPVNKLKIDQSFIRNIMQLPDNQAITRAIIALGKSLGLKVVAEGVDSASASDFLRHEGCDLIQGYHSGRPMPAEAFAALLKNSA